MKIIFTIFLILFTQFLFSQELSVLDKQKIQKVNNTADDYVGKKFKNLLQDLPEIKMIRIAPDMPQLGFSTIIIGFVNNAKYSEMFRNNIKREVLILYVKGFEGDREKSLKLDINKKEAIKKYGNLEIVAVLKRQ
ncbi:MAG: hypothetical protein Q4G16_10485 [Cruoricaptor ignavus]|nr:hypothetical protein [Cruoricaptor ignavus]